MTQSIPNLRADASTLAAADNAATRNDVVQAALVGALVQQLRQSMEESVKARLHEVHQQLGPGGGRMGSVKTFDWVTQKPSSTYYPVTSFSRQLLRVATLTKR